MIPKLDIFLTENFTDGSYIAKKDIASFSESTKINVLDKSLQDSFQYMQEKLHASKFAEDVQESKGDLKALPSHGYDKLIVPMLTILSNKVKEHPNADIASLQVVNEAVDNLVRNAGAFKNCYTQGVAGANGSFGAIGRYLYETMTLSVIAILVEYTTKVVDISADQNGQVSISLIDKNKVSLEKKFLVTNLKKLNTMIRAGELGFILTPNNYVKTLAQKAKKFDVLQESTIEDERSIEDEIKHYLSESFIFTAAGISLTVFAVVVILRLAVYYFYTIRESLASGLRELAYFIELNTLMSSSKNTSSKEAQLDIVKKMKQYAVAIEVDTAEAEKGIATQAKSKNDFITAAKSHEIKNANLF